MEEVKKEIAHLQHEVSKLHIFELAILVLVLFTIICFQVQYSRIHSYYQSSLEEDRQIALHSPRSAAAEDYEKLVTEYLEMIGGRQNGEI